MTPDGSSVDIVMPSVSPTMAYGTLVRWMKQVGDTVEPGDVIAEIETDKSIVELEAEVRGSIGAWLVAEGTEEVPVGTALVRIDTAPGFTADSPSPREPAHSVAAPSAPPDNVAELRPRPAAPVAAAPSTERGSEARPMPPSAPAVATEQSTLSLVGAIAAQLGVTATPELSADELLARVGTPAAVPRPMPPPAPVKTLPGTARPDAAEVAAHLGTAFSRHPLSGMRKTIARRMQQAKQDTPHFYLSTDCDVGGLNALRASLNERAGYPRISVNDLLIAAAARALAAHPEVNVAWNATELVQYGQVDIAVAVATDAGLVTPVLREVDTKPIDTVSAQMRELGERAQHNRLGPTDCLGGGMTLSNLGMYGIREAIAVINPPQACILAIGAALDAPVITNGIVAVGKRMRCTLSVDHRAVDGATAARMLKTLQDIIETPAALGGS